ncbi:MAG: methyltransferase domain-containing protein [Acidobacteria bacterium]|nr:methyltransferase domain-containing protein [Acidobacteriota bacterium]
MENVVEKMRADWNARAKEDAHYYVAFGRRDQDDDEFQSTAAEVVHGLEWEMRRLPATGNVRARRALEIGCGPGRLLRPMAKHFGEIHGVDISDEMVERARQRLAAVPHAHAHVALNSNLEMFCDDSFDFIYSYAVFQHIPSRDVVLGYLRDAWRVLKPGGYIRCQLNGLPETAARYDTWSGVRISAESFRAFCRDTGFRMYGLEGVDTQYMWTTLQKPAQTPAVPSAPAIRRITNAQNSEPAAPVTGRFAALSLWVDGLPEEADILSLDVRTGGLPATLTYIGPREHDGLAQVNLRLPAGLRTGLCSVEIAGAKSKVRIVPAPPAVPRVIALSDGINLMSGPRIESRAVKLTVEEMTGETGFRATVDGVPVEEVDIFCTDPVPPRHEINFRIPARMETGGHVLQITLGRRALAPLEIEVVA